MATIWAIGHAAFSSGPGVLWKSIDDGANWTNEGTICTSDLFVGYNGDGRRLGGVDADDMVYASGDNGIWRRTPEGGSWVQVLAAGGNVYKSIFVIAADDIWAVGHTTGYAAVARHWNGSVWEDFSVASRAPMIGIGDTTQHMSVWASGPNDVWVCGERDSKGPGPTEMWGYVIHTADGGTTWTDRSPNGMPQGATGPVKNELAHMITGFAADDVWICGDAESGPFAFVHQWTGSAWVDKSDATLNAAGESFRVIVGRSASDIWVGSFDNEMVAHYDGASWTVIATPISTQWGNYCGLALDGDKEVWFGCLHNSNPANVIQSNRPPVTAFTNRHNASIVYSDMPCSLWAPDLPAPPVVPGYIITDLDPIEDLEPISQQNDLAFNNNLTAISPEDDPVIPPFSPPDP